MEGRPGQWQRGPDGAGRVRRQAECGPRCARPAMRAPPVASGTRRPARCGRTLPSRRVFFFFFPSAATEAGALSTSSAPGAGRWQAHSWALKWTHRAREHSPGPRLLPGVSEPRRVGLAERSPWLPGDRGGSGVVTANPGRMRSTEGAGGVAAVR